MSTRQVHLLCPAGYDDPRRPSGGNVYDRQVRDGLNALGWTVVDQQVSGAWPAPVGSIETEVERQLALAPDGGLVVVDGLLGAAETALLRHAQRLRLVALAHMPGPPGGPRPAVLSALRLLITTSAWTAAMLAEESGLDGAAIVVARPGVEPAELAPGTPTGGSLLCVAPVVRAKGYDVLVRALAGLVDIGSSPGLTWRCTCVGSLDGDPGFVGEQQQILAACGIEQRVRFAGVRTGAELDRCYRDADLLVLPTRSESYGMVVTEALAHGLPVVASAVGGVPEALGLASDGERPGILVPPDDPDALRAALASWLTDSDLRTALRSRARERRTRLSGWDRTVATISSALERVLDW